MNSKLFENIIPVKAGLWSREVDLIAGNLESSSLGYTVKEVENGKGEIKAVSIDKLLEKYHIPQFDIIKMDVEGAEFPIFSADKKDWLYCNRLIIIEIHDDYNSEGRKMIDEIMKEFGYERIGQRDGDVYYLK